LFRLQNLEERGIDELYVTKNGTPPQPVRIRKMGHQVIKKIASACGIAVVAATTFNCAKGKDTADGEQSAEVLSVSPQTPSNPTQAPPTNSTVNPNTNTDTPTSPEKIGPIAWPNLGFVNNPGGNDPKAVALTFDDGPDGSAPIQWGKASPSNMSAMLDQLDKLKLKATFFLCGNLWTDVTKDSQAQADLQRLVAAGHHVASHTYTHQYLIADTERNRAAGKTPMSISQVREQFDKNVAAFSSPKALGPSLAQFTMYRAPYGNPFQDGIVYPPDAVSIEEDVTGIASGTPPNAVHVGWGIDTDDWQCAQSNSDSNCILSNLNAFLDAGASGPILMHTVYSLSAEALPKVVQSIYNHGYHIVMVEDMIKAKYGAYSAEISRANAAHKFDTSEINEAAVASAKESKWYKRTNER
jgi:peptidoglycan/xylan/chitin deacetylase (PgdA/CDA1 family)